MLLIIGTGNSMAHIAYGGLGVESAVLHIIRGIFLNGIDKREIRVTYYYNICRFKVMQVYKHFQSFMIM